MGQWYLIYCKPGQDTRAEVNLIRQSFEVFRPTFDVIKRQASGKTQVKTMSLFPRYLFIFADPTVQSLSPVLSTFGIASFVKFGDRYATAPATLIDELKELAESAEPLDTQTFKKGEEIFVDGHGFENVRAIYCNPCGESRSMILMNILGKTSRMSVPTECLNKAAN